MASLTSWHSSSLTVVSPPQTHSNHHSPPAHHLFTRQPRFALPSRSKMAKIGFLVVVALLVVIVVGFVIADTLPSSDSARPKTRSKSLALKRKRLGVTTPPPEETTLDENDGLVTEFQEPWKASEESPPPTTTRPPKSKKTARSQQPPPERPPHDPNVPLPEGCGECDVSSCKHIPESNCQAGLVLDYCSCCFVCGSGEGHRCYNASVPNLSYNSDVGVCGTGLSCILRSDLDPSEPREALCECRNKKMVCGNNKQTYNSECKIREAAYAKSGLSIASWGPCVSAPWMPSGVENITVGEGQDVSLSCEVRAFPSPVIHWEYVSDESNGATTILPGDDSSVVVVVRGGPEETMSTSWIQIIEARRVRQGTYHCVARNAEGVTRSPAFVTIVDPSSPIYDN